MSQPALPLSSDRCPPNPPLISPGHQRRRAHVEHTALARHPLPFASPNMQVKSNAALRVQQFQDTEERGTEENVLDSLRPSRSHEEAASPAAHLPCTRGQEERWHEFHMSDGGQHNVGHACCLCFSLSLAACYPETPTVCDAGRLRAWDPHAAHFARGVTVVDPWEATSARRGVTRWRWVMHCLSSPPPWEMPCQSTAAQRIGTLPKLTACLPFHFLISQLTCVTHRLGCLFA